MEVKIMSSACDNVYQGKRGFLEEVIFFISFGWEDPDLGKMKMNGSLVGEDCIMV